MAVTKTFKCSACRAYFDARVEMLETKAVCKCGAIAHVAIQAPALSAGRNTEGKPRLQPRR